MKLAWISDWRFYIGKIGKIIFDRHKEGFKIYMIRQGLLQDSYLEMV